MKNTKVIMFLILLLTCSIASALDWTTQLQLYYATDNATTQQTITLDYANHCNMTLNSVTANTSGYVNQAVQIVPNNYMSCADNAYTDTNWANNLTINFWYKPTFSGSQTVLGKDSNTLGRAFYFYGSATGDFHWSANPAVDDTEIINDGTLINNAWHMITVVRYSNGSCTTWVNNTLHKNIACAAVVDNTAALYIGKRPYVGAEAYLTAYVDELGVWARSFTQTEIDELWNSGAGNSPYSTGPSATTDLYITAIDQWNSSAIPTFSINISWANGTTTTYSTSSGNIYLTNLDQGGTTYSITFWNTTSYLTSTYTGVALVNATNNTYVGNMHQAEICFDATAKVSNAAVTLNNVTIQSTVKTSPFCYNITAGTYNAKGQKTGWYPQNKSFSVTALDQTTITIQNMSYDNLTISARDAVTNESITDCASSIYSITYPAWSGEAYSGTMNHSYYVIDGTYTAQINCTGYARDYNIVNITVSSHKNYTFTLYKSNSVSINIYDEIFNTPILSNITIRWTNNATTWENVTSTGELFIHNLTPSNYTLLFYGSNYSTRTYTITVGAYSTQFLNAYLVSSIYSTIFTVLDKDTGDTMSDVGFTVYKLVNSTWTTVESKYSDITGKVQIYYDPIGNYRFYLNKANYEDLIFYLNPILFETYDVFIEKSSPLNYSVDYDDISIIYSPNIFNNNATTQFNFLISSPEGQLTSYGIKLTYPGGISTSSGVNAIGEQLSTIITINNATRWDSVVLEYNYSSSISGVRTFKQILSINTNITGSQYTMMANTDRTYGLGIYERVLIITIIIIFVVGIATLVGQPIPGVAMSLMMYGYFVYIQFVPIWAVLPSMIIGVIFLVWKSGA